MAPAVNDETCLGPSLDIGLGADPFGTECYDRLELDDPRNPEIITTLPTRSRFKEELLSCQPPPEIKKCSLCESDFQRIHSIADSIIVVRTPCSHYFHQLCILAAAHNEEGDDDVYWFPCPCCLNPLYKTKVGERWYSQYQAIVKSSKKATMYLDKCARDQRQLQVLVFEVLVRLSQVLRDDIGIDTDGISQTAIIAYAYTVVLRMRSQRLSIMDWL
ncbi:hypothetical protein M011DRAFT_462116 [Sporormia fimetaria CBS 119925]|uniref:RING-type domain-containing protein n=1 Tax=Sporormia fimetaria CBS 119925 TaxID=1340428 RepID=A0A6A6V0V5_9PLEO|nr:hypothetical protein M011DRAFT_462116 [Sporormia fimetaria CBS 119925]